MINENKAKKYCYEHISSIENYNRAVWDLYEKWEIHHRRETDANGRTLFTRDQLKEMDLYYNRPASELIFVTRSMHWKLHKEMCEKGGKNSKGGKIGGGKHKKPILQFTKYGEFIREWSSICEASIKLGISKGNICSCCKGNIKNTKDFIWKYKQVKNEE